MPLQEYGVLLGTMQGYNRDQPDNYGKYYHAHISVMASGQPYNAAIDVDSNRPNVSVQWRVLHLRVDEWQTIFTLADGFHLLPSNESSGATDYYRDPRLRSLMLVPDVKAGPIPWWKRFPEAWNVVTGKEVALNTTTFRFLSLKWRLVDVTPPWKSGTGLQALVDLEAMLVDVARIVIFGEFYPSSNGKPPGLHDIHLNQGDPPNTPWWNLNGIWQDGITICIHSDGTASAFMNKFSTQAMQTDHNGHPL